MTFRCLKKSDALSVHTTPAGPPPNPTKSLVQRSWGALWRRRGLGNGVCGVGIAGLGSGGVVWCGGRHRAGFEITKPINPNTLKNNLEPSRRGPSPMTAVARFQSVLLAPRGFQNGYRTKSSIMYEKSAATNLDISRLGTVLPYSKHTCKAFVRLSTVALGAWWRID